MATGTKRQTLEEERRGSAQKRSASDLSHAPQRGSRITRGTQLRERQVKVSSPQSGLENINAKKLARGLGWFSLGLGLAEVLAPRGVARIAGVRGNTGLIRLFGLREIASGIAIFAQDAQGQRPAIAVWSRVVGDALDLAALGAAAASPSTNKGRVAFATANVLAVTALDVLCAARLSGDSSDHNSTTGGNAQVEKSLIIDSSPEELYRFWRDLENLPRFMRHLESVRVSGDGRSHWVAKAPAGTSVEWDAEITEDRPGELIAWRSVEGSEVENSGSVRFERAPGGRGTIVKVEIAYNPPGGVLGELVAKLTGDDPGQQSQEALRCLKQLMETGEVTLSDGTVWDNGLLTQRPARPVSGEGLNQSQGAATA